MNKEEARLALFALTREYMSHKPKERKKLYEKYIADRNEVKAALARTIVEEKEKEQKAK